MKRVLVILLAALLLMLPACKQAELPLPEPSGSSTTASTSSETTTSATEPGPTEPVTENPTTPSHMPDTGIEPGRDDLPDRLEPQVPDISEHETERTIDYIDPETGKTVKKEPLPPEEHRWLLDHDHDGHWKVCSFCGETDGRELHAFDQKGICSVCGYGCEHTFTEEVITPTCTISGCTVHTCTLCGYSYVSDALPAAGHRYEAQVETPATCMTDGVKRYTCSDCSANFTWIIPSTGHTVVNDPGVEATCKTEGRTAGMHCSVCGQVLVAQQAIPVRDHVYENGICIWCGGADLSNTTEKTTATDIPNDPTQPVVPTEPTQSEDGFELPEIPAG